MPNAGRSDKLLCKEIIIPNLHNLVQSNGVIKSDQMA